MCIPDALTFRLLDGKCDIRLTRDSSDSQHDGHEVTRGNSIGDLHSYLEVVDVPRLRVYRHFRRASWDDAQSSGGWWNRPLKL